MIAFVVIAAAAGCAGAVLGFIACGFCRDQALIDAEEMRAEAERAAFVARRDLLVAQGENERLQARVKPTFSTGPGSPWAPVTEAAETAP